ncbi:protein transport protein sec23, putative [Leishmania tarentolae]|uniref:Protein transport protein SEC23 n=1 Tax=Leishmania tarentolae TaxID=5689 RepID=A0A640KFD2_LEITA|nr:protein transport protein sec23, putative [Leishmania tarentolae]
MNQGYSTYYSQATPQGGAYGGTTDYYGGVAVTTPPARGGVSSGCGAQAQPQQLQAQETGANGAAAATSAGSWSNSYQGLGEYNSGVATTASASSPSQGYYGGGAQNTPANSFQVGYDGYAQGVTAATSNNGAVAAGASNPSYAGGATMAAYNPQPMQPLQEPYYAEQPPQGGYYGNTNAGQAHRSPAVAAAPAPAALNATDENGLRWTWSCYPTTSKTKTKDAHSAATLSMPEMVIPMSCMYTPLNLIEPSHLVLGATVDELRCSNCGAFCCVYSEREMGKYWVCLSCKRRNSFPPNTAITEQHPALMYETVEFVLANPPTPVLAPTQSQVAPAFIFVVDTCIPSGEMASLRTSLLESLQHLPRNALVGLITFGATVSVWELGAHFGVTMSKCYLLRGNTANPPESLQSMLQVSESHPVRGRLLAPLCDVEAVLTSLIQELAEDDAAVPSSKRPLRATSTAVEAATYLMEALTPPQITAQQQYALYGKGMKAPAAPANNSKMGKILLFTGGPCTRGPGAIVSTDKADMMRFHRDIIEGDTPYYEAAFNFYNALEPRLINANTCLDVFAQSLDQVGVMEMRRCIDNTGGTLIVEDETTDIMFLESLKRYWQRSHFRTGAELGSAAAQEGTSSSGVDGSCSSEDHRAHCGFGVHMEVNTSIGTLLRGALGPCNVDVEANKRGPTRPTSPLEVGVGGTTRWRVSYLDKGMTLSFLFDTATSSNQQGGEENSALERRFIQFVTRYTTPRGEQRVRVTSIMQPVAPSSASPDYYTTAGAFDQTCAATIVARMAVSILEKHPGKWDDAKRWLDTLLVRFVRRYATFSPGDSNTLRLDPCLSLFPCFMYNLRRSEYFMVLNISPDETTFKRHWLLRESVDNCVLMIQPTLDSYDLEKPFATPMQLDSSSLHHDNIVLMDAYFNVHIMWGSVIYQWIEAAYHENPQYANFAELLEAAERDAQGILASRYPYPRFSRTDADGSEARHVKTRVNPATNYHNSGIQYGAGPNGAVGQADIIYTDDASIMTFMASLKKAVMASDSKET